MGRQPLKEKYKVPPEELTDGEITLRRWRIDDVDALAAAAAPSLPELQRWMPFAANGYNEDDARKFLTFTTAEWDQGRIYDYALIVDGAVAGSFGLMDPIYGTDGVGMGYWVSTPLSGRGLATRAAALLTDCGFGIGAELVQIWHRVENDRSKAIPRRLGYQFMGDYDFSDQPGETPKGLHGLWQKRQPKTGD